MHKSSSSSSSKRPQSGSGRKPSPTFANGNTKFSLHAPLPSPKERQATTTFSDYSRPIRAINLDDTDLLSQSDNYDNHESEQNRSSLLESPAVRSLLGSEVARQKHEYYMSQHPHLASQSQPELDVNTSNWTDNGEQSDETTAIAASVDARTVIERLQHEVDPLSNDELALLIEQLQDTLHKRGGKSTPMIRGQTTSGSPVRPATGVGTTPVNHSRPSVPSPFRSLDTMLVTEISATSKTTTALKSKTPSPYNHHHHHHHSNNNISTKDSSKDHTHVHGYPSGQTAISSATSTSNPATILGVVSTAAISSVAVVTGNTNGAMGAASSTNSGMSTQYVSAYVPSGSPTIPSSALSTPRIIEQSTSATTPPTTTTSLPFASFGGTGNHSKDKDLISMSVLAAFEESLLPSYGGRENMRRSLSGDATHIRGSHREKMEALSSGYHKMFPEPRIHGHKKSNNATLGNASNTSQSMGVSNVKTSVEDDDAELRAAPTPTPTKGVPAERNGAIPPLLEAWPPSPHPDIFESTIKHPTIHSPKVKSNKIFLRTPKVNYASGNDGISANQQRDLSNDDKDSLTIVSFDDQNSISGSSVPTLTADIDSTNINTNTNIGVGVGVGGSNPTTATVVTRGTSEDSALAHYSVSKSNRQRNNVGREASGLVTSPNTAFDDLSVSSTNSAGGSVRSLSSRSLEPQSTQKAGHGHIHTQNASKSNITSATTTTKSSARTGIFSFLSGPAKTL